MNSKQKVQKTETIYRGSEWSVTLIQVIMGHKWIHISLKWIHFPFSILKTQGFMCACSTNLKCTLPLLNLPYKTVLRPTKELPHSFQLLADMRINCSSSLAQCWKKVGLQQGTVFALWVEHALLISQLILTDPVKREREKQENIFFQINPNVWSKPNIFSQGQL